MRKQVVSKQDIQVQRVHKHTISKSTTSIELDRDLESADHVWHAGATPKATTTANERSAAHTAAAPVSGAAKRAALVSGDRKGSGGGLAAMWRKAPAKKGPAQTKHAAPPSASHAAADANDALRLADQVG